MASNFENGWHLMQHDWAERQSAAGGSFASRLAAWLARTCGPARGARDAAGPRLHQA